MLTVKPELDLPKTLELCCPQDIIEWVKNKLSGIRYISIKLHTGRQKYDQFAKIEIQENPAVKQIPEEKSDEICELIYRILQCKIEELDDTANFFIQIYNRTAVGDKASGRHITVENKSDGDRESKSYNPETIAPNLLDAQMTYVQMLQDNVANMLAMWGEVMKPIIDTNQSLQAELAAKRQDDYNLRNLELTWQLRKEEREAEIEMERIRAKASKDKLDSAFKALNKDGALGKIISQAGNKFLGGGDNQAPPQEIRKIPQRKESVQQVPVIIKPVISPEEEQKQAAELIRKEMENNPLYTYCSLLKSSLNIDTIENPEDSIKMYMEETLRDSLHKDLMDLINSENENEAKKNLVNLTSNTEPSDYEGLMNIRNRLDDTQRSIIDNILNYNG